MSAHSIRVPVIRCDATFEVATIICEVSYKALPEITTVRAMRRHLRALGWHTLKGGRDICPDHWSEGHR